MVGMVDYPAEFLKALAALPDALAALCRDLTVEQEQHRPSSGEWSAREICGHLVDVERHVIRRVERILADDQPHLESFDHDAAVVDGGHQQVPVAVHLQAHRALRARTVDLLTGDGVDWTRPCTHDAHGLMTLEAYVVHVVCEEVDHVGQLARTIGMAR